MKRSFLRRRGGFRRDSRGVSAVEFALILPFMLLLLLGGVELSDALTVKRKVTQIASSLSDLLTQAKTMSTSDLNGILDAAKAIIAPYPTGNLKIKIAGVSIDSKGKATVSWSGAYNDTAATKGSSISLPTEVDDPSTFIVTAEVHYAYTPSIGYALTGTFDIDDQFYLRPRLSSTITWQ